MSCPLAHVLLLFIAACRILYAFKLNPYEQLNLRFTATPEEIRKQYRKLSLMVHPDKCKHEKASEAFEGRFWCLAAAAAAAPSVLAVSAAAAQMRRLCQQVTRLQQAGCMQQSRGYKCKSP
jgi:hypothetical protein